jgi:hypothetical protein
MFVALALLIGIASYLMWRAVWPSPPDLMDQCDDRRSTRDSIPIVVVGVLASDTLVRKPVPMHSDPKYPLQLRKLIVRVENVLRGAPIPETITVYYFTWAGGFDGPQPLGFWKVGGRRILWLRRDSGVLRTACDGWDYCTKFVGTGAHPHYTPDPRKPIDFALVDLLFTRGEGTVNENGFGTELDEVTDQVQGLQAYSIEKLRHLAQAEHGYIRSCACRTLWVYTVDHPIDPAIHRDADKALHEADCRCTTKPDGSEECQ